MHVLLELANALGAEGVRDGLALASVLGTVSCVEETALNRHESIIVLTFALSAYGVHEVYKYHIRFEEASSVAVDDRDSIRVGDRDLVRRDSNQFAILCMCLVNSQVSATQTALPQIPEVGELGQERSGDILYRPIPHIRENEEQQRQRQQRPWGEEQRQEHGCRLYPEQEGADSLLLQGSEV